MGARWLRPVPVTDLLIVNAWIADPMPPKKGPNGALLVPQSEGVAAQTSRARIETFVDWLLLDPMYNVRAVPDSVERAVYINCFELITNLLAGALSTFEVQLMGRNVKVKLSEARETRDLRKVSRFRPKPDILRQLSRQLSGVEAMQEVMCQVYAFVLAFAAYEMSNVSVRIVGRQLSFRLTQPASDSLSPEDLEAAMEGEFSAKLRGALEVMVQEMLVAVDAADLDASDLQTAVVKDSIIKQTSPRGGQRFFGKTFPKVPAGITRWFGESGGRGPRWAWLVEDERKEAETPGDVDSIIYRTFVSFHTPAGDAFPFPYLTPDAFAKSLADLVVGRG